MPEIDPQDPLPEPSFLWRRLVTIGLLVAMGLAVWWLAPRVPSTDVLTLLGWVLLFGFGALTYYVAGASAADIGGLIANFKLRIGKDKES